MAKNKSNFVVIFEELERLSKEPEFQFIQEELNDYDEIRALREIVLELRAPSQTYFTST